MIERSPGISTGAGFLCGNGYRGATEQLDALVKEAARVLEGAYGMDVTIRFNSDRRSGSAWLKTDAVDGVWLNAEVGIGGSVGQDGELRVHAHVGRRVGEYAHVRVEDIEEGLSYVQANADLSL